MAYYLARHARRTKKLLLVLLIVPFWVSYLMRMLAWIGLLLPDGLVNRTLIDLGVLSHPYGWLDGQASSVILALDLRLRAVSDPAAVRDARPDRAAACSRPAATSARARSAPFLHVTLPLSRHGILAASVLIALPMFGDYYTNDVISGSPRTTMIGNQINLFFQGGPQRTVGASLVDRPLGIARGADVVLPLGHRARVAGGARMKRVPRLVGEPVGTAAVARGRDVAVHGRGRSSPCCIAVLFSFNDGRSRSVWQGFSTRWYWGDPDQSVLHDPALRRARSSRASGSRRSTC